MRRIAVLLLFVLSCATYSLCREAKVVSITPSGAQSIDPKKDHYSIVFLSGWVSKNDSVFARIFQNAKKLTAEADGNSHFFDGEDVPKAWIFNNTDVGHELNRPWAGAAQKPVIENYPADTASRVTVQASFYSDDRFSELIQSFQNSEPTAGIDAEPYITYAKLADSLFVTLFGTDKTVYPFIMTFELTPVGQSFSERYYVGVAPNSDNGDQLITNINSDVSKLSYNEASNSLSYNGTPIQDHTWAVFKLVKGDAIDVARLTLQSKASWAVLAASDFLVPTVPNITAQADVAKQDANAVSALGTELSLLKTELRFSAFDRATALLTFATAAKDVIKNACIAGGVPESRCRTPQTDNFISRIKQLFPELSPATHAEVVNAASTVRSNITQLLRQNLVDRLDKLEQMKKENKLNLR